MSSARDVESPHIKVAMAKPVTPHIIERRRPNLFAIQPASGMVTAVAIKFDVTTQEIWSGLADNAPWIWGNETFAIVKFVP